MTSRMTEIWVGIFVAIGMAALFMLAMKVSNLSTYNSGEGFDVIARFDDASGLKVRSPVTMAGVRIGRVKDIVFDDQTFEAIVTMRLGKRHSTLPQDTSASIYTAGLLGENMSAWSRVQVPTIVRNWRWRLNWKARPLTRMNVRMIIPILYCVTVPASP